MPQFTRVGVVQQAQAPSLRGSNARVDLGAFASGLTRLTRVTQARQQANAKNRGRSRAYQLQRAMALPLAKYRQEHETEADFAETYTQFYAETQAEMLQEVGAPESEAEELAFDAVNDQYALGNLTEAYDSSHVAWTKEQTAVTLDTLKDSARGTDTMSDDLLQATYVNMSHTVGTAVGNDKDSAGFWTHNEGRLIFDTQVRAIELGRVITKMREDPATVLNIIGEDSEGATIAVPYLDKNMEIARNPDGSVAVRHEFISSEEREALKKASENEIAQRGNIMAGLTENLKLQHATEVSAKAMSYMERIHNGEIGVAAEMVGDNLPGIGPMWTRSDITAMHEYEKKIRMDQTNGLTTNRAAHLELLDRALQGHVSFDELLATEEISRGDVTELMKINATNVNRQNDQQNTLFFKRKATASRLIMKQFGMTNAFVTDKTKANFVPGLLIAFEERMDRAFRQAQLAGESVNNIDPLHEAQRLIGERHGALLDVLIPESAQLQRHLVRYQRQAKANVEQPSMADVYNELWNARQNNEIGPTEFEQQQLILNAVVRRGQTYEEFSELMNDDSLVTPTLPDGAIPPDKGGTDTTGEPSVEIMKGIDYLLGLMQGTAPFGSDVSRFFPNAKEDN